MDQAAGFTYAINWGDGSPTQVVQGPSGIQVDHVFTTIGTCTVTVLTDPEDSTKVKEIKRSEVEEIKPSTVSLMPNDLLKPLNQEEVLDLMAYLLSRGDPNHPMFKPEPKKVEPKKKRNPKKQ